MKRTILIVEDDHSLRGSLRRHLSRTHKVIEAANCAEAFEILEGGHIDVLVVDIVLPDGQGFELADRAVLIEPRPAVIVMTGDDRIDSAILALQHGAADFLLKPFSLDALDTALRRATHGIKVEFSNSEVEPEDVESVSQWRRRFAPDILGQDPKLVEVLDVMRRVSDTDVSVLVTGESGTGKELVARALRDGGSRHNKPYITVNCAAIPDNLLESELFGHMRGAFTGATEDRTGRFAAADGGTLFLDEIGELPIGLQPKILRTLQERQVTPLGMTDPISIDVRIISATNRQIDKMVEAGRFREDLLYRLNIIHVEIPPLRDRRGDIPELVHCFIERANNRRNRRIEGMTDDALEVLCGYDWPGNIRQLENTIERMVVLRSEGRLSAGDVPSRIKNSSRASMPPQQAPMLPPGGIDLAATVERFENSLILQALERTGWNKNQAANLLKMNRTTLVEKLKKKKISQPG